MKVKDQTGKIVNNLKVLYRLKKDHIEPNGTTRPMQRCQCILCGDEFDVQAGYLRKRTARCPCKKKRKKRPRERKFNKYELDGEYGIGYTINHNMPFYFDLEDYQKIEDYKQSDSKGKYIVSVDEDGRMVQMQKVIMTSRENWHNLSIQIDHIDHNGFDNRKSNLRICNASQNNSNKTTRADNKSGFSGVIQVEKKQRQRVYIEKNGKVHWNGSFKYEDYTLAVRKRIILEKLYFKEFFYKDHQKVLDYINNGGKLEPGNKEMIKRIMKGEEPYGEVWKEKDDIVESE